MSQPGRARAPLAALCCLLCVLSSAPGGARGGTTPEEEIAELEADIARDRADLEAFMDKSHEERKALELRLLDIDARLPTPTAGAEVSFDELRGGGGGGGGGNVLSRAPLRSRGAAEYPAVRVDAAGAAPAAEKGGGWGGEDLPPRPSCLGGMHAIIIGGVGKHPADQKHVDCAGRLKGYIKSDLGLPVHHSPPVFLTPENLEEGTEWLVGNLNLDPSVIENAEVPRGEGHGERGDLALKGVALAHMVAYKYILDNDIQQAFIFEADADLVPGFLEVFCPLWDDRPPDGYFFQVGTQFSRRPNHKMWDMLPHVTHRGSCCQGGAECHRWFPGVAWGLNAYIISNEAAGVMYGLARGGSPWHAVADQLNHEDPRRYYLSMDLPAETSRMASGGRRPDWLKFNVQCGLGLQRVGECKSVRLMLENTRGSGERAGTRAALKSHHSSHHNSQHQHRSRRGSWENRQHWGRGRQGHHQHRPYHG